jgi:hypothetical protein
MAKNNSAADEHRNGAVRDHSGASGQSRKRGREILFPTEPSTIGNEKIDRAIERVLSRKK